jgi:glycosyltransferase involved in cell wall biosynthesis
LYVFYNLKDFIKKKIIKFLMIAFYRNSNKIIANSRTVAKSLQKLVKTKVDFIYPPSVNKVYKYKRPNFNKKNCLKILTVGRLAVEKNLKIIILSLKYLKFLNFKLFILGNGPEKKRLIKFVRNNKLNNKIKFFPHTDNLSEFYRSSDLFINSSDFEGFPNAVVEAINYNLPVICSNSGGGIKEILLNGKGGTIFDSKDYLELSRKINFFRENPNSFYKKLILAKKNINKFTLKKNVVSYNSIFNSLLK